MSTQTDARKNIKVSSETRAKLNNARGDQTWDGFLRQLVDDATVERHYNDISDERVGEIAEKTAEEIEERLR